MRVMVTDCGDESPGFSKPAADGECNVAETRRPFGFRQRAFNQQQTSLGRSPRGFRSPQAVVGDEEVANDGKDEGVLNAHLVG